MQVEVVAEATDDPPITAAHVQLGCTCRVGLWVYAVTSSQLNILFVFLRMIRTNAGQVHHCQSALGIVYVTCAWSFQCYIEPVFFHPNDTCRALFYPTNNCSIFSSPQA